MLELHALELTNSGLINLGKPEGYVARQVAGWSERYLHAQTDDIPELKNAFDWLARNQPEHSSVAFIHNDFKFDNMVIRDDASVAAVLDWEMATVGDPLMDLGTTLAYWAEEGDPDILKMFNLVTWDDPANTNIINIEPRDDFYSSRQRVLDWTYILDKSQQKNHTPFNISNAEPKGSASLNVIR